MHQHAGSLGWDIAGSKAEGNYGKWGAPRDSGTAFSHVAAPLAKVSGLLSMAACFIDQSKNRAAIYGIWQLEKQCFSADAVIDGDKIDNPAVVFLLKAGFFLGGRYQMLAGAAAALSKPSSAGTAWMTQEVPFTFCYRTKRKMFAKSWWIHI